MSSDDPIRSFVAVEITEEARRRFADLARLARDTGAHVSWVKPEGIHLTLAFLGDVPGTTLDALHTAMDVVASDVPPFRYEIAGIGSFGNPRAPRIIWAGVREDSGVLARLQSRLAEEIRGLGIPLEDRAFVPHVTVARIRSARNIEGLLESIQVAREWPFGWVPVERVVLVASRLTPQGPVYNDLYASALRGTP